MAKGKGKTPARKAPLSPSELQIEDAPLESLSRDQLSVFLYVALTPDETRAIVKDRKLGIPGFRSGSLGDVERCDVIADEIRANPPAARAVLDALGKAFEQVPLARTRSMATARRVALPRRGRRGPRARPVAGPLRPEPRGAERRVAAARRPGGPLLRVGGRGEASPGPGDPSVEDPAPRSRRSWRSWRAQRHACARRRRRPWPAPRRRDGRARSSGRGCRSHCGRHVPGNPGPSRMPPAHRTPPPGPGRSSPGCAAELDASAERGRRGRGPPGQGRGPRPGREGRGPRGSARARPGAGAGTHPGPGAGQGRRSAAGPRSRPREPALRRTPKGATPRPGSSRCTRASSTTRWRAGTGASSARRSSRRTSSPRTTATRACGPSRWRGCPGTTGSGWRPTCGSSTAAGAAERGRAALAHRPRGPRPLHPPGEDEGLASGAGAAHCSRR